MKLRLFTIVLLAGTLCAAIWGASAYAQSSDTNLEITEFAMEPIEPLTSPHAYDPKQAGGNSDVALYWRFCGPGLEVTDITNVSGAWHVTTSTPHNMPGFSFAKITGATRLGAPASVNGLWGAGAVDADTFRLNFVSRPPDLGERYSSGTHAQIPSGNTTEDYGCVGEQPTGKLADFKVKLPPGFLGDPTSAEACPTFLVIASSCSDRSILGHSVTETVVEGANATALPNRIPTPVYNVQTMGLEPARLGTNQLPSEPTGPFPIEISLRTTEDYGINSALVDIPKNLGGPQALVTQIETILCARVPCKATDSLESTTVEPLARTRPFFRNPTSCDKPATAVLEARSWARPGIRQTKTKSYSFTPTGCDAVQFDLAVADEPTETDKAGIASGHRVSLAYPDYDEADIWQSQLKDVDINLPEGLTLAAAGGVGLKDCSFSQFGVNAAGKQISDAPVTCPEGSQIGTLDVTSPVLDFPLGGRAFFGPVSAPGRPTRTAPWKLFLLIEGAGLRIKLVGDVAVSENGQVSNVFTNQPEVPFTRLDVNLNGGTKAILQNPSECGTHEGSATLVGWAGKTNSTDPANDTDGLLMDPPSVTATGTAEECARPRPFSPVVEEASGTPKSAGANSVSKIVFSRKDGEQDLKSLQLILPPGAAGSLAAAPSCPLAQAQAGSCPDSTRIGTIRNTVGSGNALLTVPGELYLADAMAPGDAASIAVRVPAKVGPIDLGQVVLMNRVQLRESDNALVVTSTDIPAMLEGVPLPIRRVEILVDRPGFFLNPTGCEPRTLTANFNGHEGASSTSQMQLDATNCAALPFGPEITLTAGAPGFTDQFDHPPFQARVVQKAGEADISQARVVLPLILRPHVPFFNEPGALCNDAQAATDTCPAKSRVGNARAFSPLLPYPISGPVHIVQEIGNVLPKVYVYLRGPTGLEVLLKARNSFLQGRRIINTFEAVPDLPQSYFELNLQGGRNGILNNFEDLCQATDSDRRYDATFNAHSGKVVTTQPRLRIQGCEESDLRAASLSSQSVRVSRKGIAKVKVRCKRSKRCSGRLVLRGKGATGAGKLKISGNKSARVKVKFSASEVKRIRKAKRLRTKATLTIGDATAGRSSVTLIGPRRR